MAGTDAWSVIELLFKRLISALVYPFRNVYGKNYIVYLAGVEFAYTKSDLAMLKLEKLLNEKSMCKTVPQMH